MEGSPPDDPPPEERKKKTLKEKEASVGFLDGHDSMNHQTEDPPAEERKKTMKEWFLKEKEASVGFLDGHDSMNHQTEDPPAEVTKKTRSRRAANTKQAAAINSVTPDASLPMGHVAKQAYLPIGGGSPSPLALEGPAGVGSEQDVGSVGPLAPLMALVLMFVPPKLINWVTGSTKSTTRHDKMKDLFLIKEAEKQKAPDHLADGKLFNTMQNTFLGGPGTSAPVLFSKTPGVSSWDPKALAALQSDGKPAGKGRSKRGRRKL
eukprot:GHVQ01035540.1.p1 GENE.GHVQ01035540.1~~GHVQ01035540.1.p1  ORF type:complete len:278 (-),score=35.84 GHVQ01035540.1:90-878(-)